MQMQRVRLLQFVMLTLFVSALFGCGSTSAPVNVSAPPISVAGHTIDFTALYAKANNYYHVGRTKYETPLMKLDNDFSSAMSEYSSGLQAKLAIAGTCISNSAAAEAFIVSSALQNLQPGGLINALAANGLTGSATAECAKNYKDISDFAETHNAKIYNAKNARFAMATDYETYLSDYIDVGIMNDLMSTYGDTALVYQKLADAGIPGITDWSWLPTNKLRATHNNEGICRYYMSGQFIEKELPLTTKLKFKGHESALASLYETTWVPKENNGAQNGLCTMYRAAALRWFQRDISTQDTKDAIGTGVIVPIVATPLAIPTVAPRRP